MNAEVLLKYFDRISEAPDAVPRLRRFVLDLAVRGKLVEQDPNDESASALLARMPSPAQYRARKQADERGSPTRAPGTSDRPAQSPSVAEDGPYELPASWWWARPDKFDGAEAQASSLRDQLKATLGEALLR
ncbi:MAG: hypothetical protein WBW33_37540 [Bryobacteraceae bacterium]